MRAWVVTGVGSPGDVMELVEREPGRPGPGELWVRVLVAGVSLPEVLMCRDLYAYKPTRPFTPGHEVVGIVLDANGQPGFEVGQRVMGVTAFYGGYGGHAEESSLIASSASQVPETMPDEHAAAFTIAFNTAWISLVVRAGLTAGETMLVHGASGGTGFAAVQLGVALGARVIAVARGPEKGESCRRDGADEVIDSADQDWRTEVARLAPDGVDVVFDPIGGEVFSQSVECLRYGGRLIPIGFASGAWGEAPIGQIVNKNVSVVGTIAVPPDEETGRRMQRELGAMYEKGQLEPRITQTYSFEDVPRALVELDERRAVGKQVVRVST